MSDMDHVTHVTEGLAEATRLGKLRRFAWAGGALAAAAIAGALVAVLLPGWAPWAGLGIATGALALALAVGLRARGLARTAARLAACAQLDPDSGLPGAIALELELRRAIEQSQRQRTPLAIVMLSFDDLRPLHVERGISAGRRMLRQAAVGLASTMGPYGGHAFRAHPSALVAVIPGTTHAEAERLAQKIAPVLSLLARKNGELVQVVAGGAVALPGDQPEDLLVRAERRCARGRSGVAEESATVMRPVPTRTH